MVRGRRAAFAGSFVALVLGAAILSLSALMLTSAAPRPPEHYAAAPVLVRAPAAAAQGEGVFAEPVPWSPETVSALVTRLRGIPSVAAAVPDRSFYAQPVVGGRPVAGEVTGRAWSGAALSPYRIVRGAPPRGDREVVAGTALGLAPGSRLTVLTAAGPAPYTVSGVTDGPGLYVGDAAAARLAGGVRVIGLRTAPGADEAAVAAAARAIVGGAGSVLTGDARAEAEPAGDRKLRWIGLQVLTAVAALGGFVSVFVVASTFAFGVAQRRREFGLLRAVGATPRQIRRTVYGEALAVGLVAAPLGVALGALAAPVLGGLLVEAELQPPSFTVGFSPWPPIAAFLLGLVVALLGAWSGSRRAAGARPLEALREAAVDTRPMSRSRWVLGLLALALTVPFGVAAATADARNIGAYGLFTAMAVTIAATLLAPVVIPPAARLLTRPLARGAIGLLVRESALTSVRRTASTAAPILLTVGFSVLVTGMVQTTTAAYAQRDTTAARAAAVITPKDTPGLPDTAAEGARSPLPTTVYRGRDPIPALGLDPADLPAPPRGDAPGKEAGPGTGFLVAAESTARRYGWRAGGVAEVTFEDGRAIAVPVAAVVPDSEAPAPVALPRAAVRAHDPSALAPVAYLGGPPDAPPGPGAEVVTPAEYTRIAETDDDRQVWIFTVILVGISAGYSALAIANTLLMATASRLRDFRTLRLSGATPRQVLATVAAESALVVGVGTLLGLAIAAVGLTVMHRGLAGEIGEVPLVIPVPVILAVVALSLVLALLASVLPARRALRHPPAAT
ncbi:ABC transporter permease [Bailinhaonella thermotolerans]|uniref:ABC transporter permease n=2 Tax=Bailinhaonella thermotolerans TaxID=1070861 RepID=A0A3A4ASR4_9ACTN|nr:ABC transporter permease [Bailinhaonella thermotolerans]